VKDEVVPAGHMSARKAEGADPACTCRTYTGSFTLTFRPGRHGHRPERQQPRARATYPVRRGPGGAAATRTKFSRRLRHLAFKCWLSERSAASELEPSRRSVLSLADQVILLRAPAVCCESASCTELDAAVRTRSFGTLGCCRSTVSAVLLRPCEPVRWRGEETGSPRRAYRHALVHCWGTT
jgi:hypothetical protein